MPVKICIRVKFHISKNLRKLNRKHGKV